VVLEGELNNLDPIGNSISVTGDQIYSNQVSRQLEEERGLDLSYEKGLNLDRPPNTKDRYVISPLIAMLGLLFIVLLLVRTRMLCGL
jgi:hypothetical protein